jgi:hypothetical protein
VFTNVNAFFLSIFDFQAKLLQNISRHLSITKKMFYGNKSSYLPFDIMWLFLYLEKSPSGKGVEVMAHCRT